VAEAKRYGFTEIYLPKENAREAALISDIEIFGVNNLEEVIEHLKEVTKIASQPRTLIELNNDENETDFSDVVGQESAKRGLEIAAAGGHNIAMYGPPGTGKTMLAKAFSGILPPLNFEEIIEITGIHSVAGVLKGDLIAIPPVRSPHHTASYVSLVGGGTVPKPGEVTLAHRGVLFLDEFPEFDKKVLETLRQPLEEREISISRARGSITFPANFILIAAMNPCPCGNHGSKIKECVCRSIDILKYQRKISGPIMDRIDMWVEVSQINHVDLSGRRNGDQNKVNPKIREKIQRARLAQEKRFANLKKKIKTNSEMNSKDLTNLVDLAREVKDTLDKSAVKLGLSARAYHRVIKLARTIADLENQKDIALPHILEALQYRLKN
jgi:magnesium chelatase family protein